jgi:hypothetical protein
MMFTPTRPSGFVRCTVALSAILGAGVAVMGAQTSQASDESATQATTQTAQADVQAKPTLNLNVPAVNSDAMFSSSSSTENEVAVNTNHFNFVDAMQYGGGSRYGRPRYRGGNTNPDGSNKYVFYGGAGFTAPVGDDSSYLKTSWGIQVGGGRQFNKHVALPIEFDWDSFGFTGQTISNQATLYFDDPTNSLYGLDGHSHIWSFSLDPTYTFYSGEGLGAYVVVGGGFYHKAANFFVPVPAEACDFYCYDYTANETVQNYSSNSAGVNGGVGLTYKFSRFSNERFYAEVRVVHTFNNYRPGITVDTPTAVAQAYTGWNYFPQNSQETTYFPVKFGIRF